MAFTIKIFENDRYLFSLLKARLETLFPDAYIVDSIGAEGPSECTDFSEFTKIVYDPRSIDMSDFHDAIPIYDSNGVIDCRRIAGQLGLSPVLRNNSVSSANTGRSFALIPYVYMEDREAMIGRMITDRFFTSDYTLRLDFMGKMRVPGPETTGINPGGMTRLLEHAAGKDFKPEDIFTFCNMDKTGFMTPGATSGEDDIFDAGLSVIRRITDASLSLTKNPSPSTSVLAVFEGFKTGELIDLVSPFGEVTVLLPSRDGQENLGAQRLISGIERNLASGRLNISYAEDLSSFGDDDYEQAL